MIGRAFVISCFLLGGRAMRMTLEGAKDKAGAREHQSSVLQVHAQDAHAEDPAPIPSPPAPPAPPTPVVSRVAIVGNVDTGKSSLCQWLLGDYKDNTVCPYFNDPKESTQEAKIWKGHWFGNPENGELEVLDTPGLLSEGDNGAIWNNIVNKIKTEMKLIDAVIMTASTDASAGAFRHKTMDQLRHTFGSALWENMAIMVKIEEGWFHLGHENTGGFDAPNTGQWTSHLDYWTKTVVDTEYKESTNVGVDWTEDKHKEAKADLDAEIDSIKTTKMFGCRLFANDYRPMVPADNIPETAGDFPPELIPKALRPPATFTWNKDKFVELSKVPDLVKLRDNIVALRETREGKGQWNVEDIRPRFGPSSVTPGQNFHCKWPHACNMTVQGTYLSEADRMRIFPKDHVCGQSFGGFGDSKLPVEFSEARPKLEDEKLTTEKHFNFGLTFEFDDLGLHEFKLCYCEFGNCDSDGRYHQEVGVLTVEDTKCPVPCQDETSLNAKLQNFVCGDDKFIKPGKTTLEWKCDVGYGKDNLPEKNEFTQTCQDSGELTTISMCPLVHCKEEPAVPGNSYRFSAHVENPTYTYGRGLIFQCKSYSGTYEEDNVKDFSVVLPDDKKLAVAFTVDANIRGTKRVDITCGAEGKWEFSTAGGDTYEQFIEQGGCRRWLVGTYGDCGATCGEGVHTAPLTCEPNEGVCNEAFKPTHEKSCTSYVGCPSCEKTAPDLQAGHAHPAYESSQVGQKLVTEGEPMVYSCDYANGYNLHGSSSTSFPKTSFQIACKKDPKEAAPKPVWSRFETPFEMTEAQALTACKRWETTVWSTCSTTCGSGYQDRKVQCSSGNDDDCTANDKPTGTTLQRSCYIGNGCDALREQQSSARDMVVGWLLALPVVASLV